IVTDAGTVDVNVSGNGLSIETSNTNPIGAGLQQGTYYVQRDGGTSGSLGGAVSNLTPTLCKVSASGTTAGTDNLNLTIASGQATSPTFWVQALDAVLGTCQLQVTASGYFTGSGSIDIVKPAIRITNLASSIAFSAANDPFNVEIGIADNAQSTLAAVQQVRAGSAGFDITVSNANSTVGQLTGSNSSNQPVTGQTTT